MTDCTFSNVTFEPIGGALGTLKLLSAFYGIVPGMQRLVADVLAGVVRNEKASDDLMKYSPFKGSPTRRAPAGRR